MSWAVYLQRRIRPALRLGTAGATVQNESSIQLHHGPGVVNGCRVSGTAVWSDPRGQVAMVAQILDPELQSPRVGVFEASLLRDILKDNAADRLSEACSRPPWRISREDLNFWFPCIRREGPVIAQSAQPLWRLQPAGDGLQQLVGLGQGILTRRESYCKLTLARPFTPTYIWQTEPPLPSKIGVDLSNHTPNPRHAPPGWVVTQRNAGPDGLQQGLGEAATEGRRLKD